MDSARLTRRSLVVGALGAFAVACSPAANNNQGGGGGSTSGKTVTVTFRLWDDQVAKAYKKSFAEFERSHKNIRVEVQTVPWDSYWQKLPQDVGSGTMADIFWTNTSNFGVYADNGSLLDLDKYFSDQKGDWKRSVVDLYTRNGKLWGVPQLWDSIALYYNKKLVQDAGIDPTKLHWDPTGKGDTFLPAARKLTVDAAGRTADQSGFDASKTQQYGFNASNDGQGIYWNFVGSNGGVWQKGDLFACGDDPKTIQAIQYVVDLIDKYKVAPPAADTNTNGNKTLDLFRQGKMALFQSGPYNLQNVAQGAKFDWAIAPMLEGPSGRVGVVHGVSAVGYAKTKHLEETLEVLKWLGTPAGQKPIADGGYAFPGVSSIESDFVAYWKRKGIDLAPFLQAASGTTFPAPLGPKINAGATAMGPTMEQIFLGHTPVAAGLKKAEKDGNDAMTS